MFEENNKHLGSNRGRQEIVWTLSFSLDSLIIFCQTTSIQVIAIHKECWQTVSLTGPKRMSMYLEVLLVQDTLLQGSCEASAPRRVVVAIIWASQICTYGVALH